MKHFLFLIFTAFISCNSSAHQKDNLSTKIDSLISITNPRSFNGVVVIEQNGKVKYSKAHGYANFDKKTPLKITDRFATMSIAKQITATLVLQEVEKGTIDLQVPVRTYLPDLKYSWADTITMHQLLNNSSGIGSKNLDEPLKFKPGTAFYYTNVGYSLAGKILEKQSHKTYKELVTALFKKCKMNDSYYPLQTNDDHLVKGHFIKENGTYELIEKTKFTPEQYFGAYLIVTAPDLAKWNECLHKGKLLKPTTYKAMISYTITNTHSLFGEKAIGYGYGLRINDKDPVYELGHTGFHPAEGFTAVNLYYPKTDTSIIVMENLATENFEIAYYFEQQIRAIVKQSQLLN